MLDKSIYVTQSSLPSYEDYIEMIRPMWNTHKLTNMGDYHKQLESELKECLGVSYISLMVNGHTALEMAIQAMEFEEGSEIITTPFTFVSTTHAILRNNMVPVFCDIKESDYTIDENKIEALITNKTVAILPVHVYGNVCNYHEIDKIAKKYNLKVIYDAAHSFGEVIDNRSVESLGDASVLSFHATKVFNTIEGGAVCSKDPVFNERLYNLKNFGIRSEESVVAVGANGKMNEFCAAMGLCNLKNISNDIFLRKCKSKLYDSLLCSIEGIILRNDKNNIIYNYGYYPVRFLNKEVRDQVYELLRKNNIYARKYFYPITTDHKCFGNKYWNSSISISRMVSDSILTLPLYPTLDDSVIITICGIITDVLIKVINK